MEEDWNSIDPFSSLIINSNTDQSINVLSNQDATARKKLKSVRKITHVMIDCSSINSSRYKFKVKYGGQFKPINKGKKEKYCYGKQKTLYFEDNSSSFIELLDDVSRLYHEDDNPKLCFLDNRIVKQLFIQFEDDNPKLCFLYFGLWGAAWTYSQSHFEDLIAEIDANCPAAMEFLNKEHTKLWSRSKFGTISKCDYLTNNIAEVFNSWVSEERHKPIIDLIDAIRQRMMVRFNEKRRIVRNWKGLIVPKVLDYIKLISRGLNAYSVHRSSEALAEVTKNGLRWRVKLEERRCSCRAWQVKGVPCVHETSLIASIRNARWEDYVDSYFMVTRLKTTYSNRIAPMPSKDKWMEYELGYKMLPPILKRPVGRPRKSSRIKAWDELTKRSHKCTRCGLYGHYRNTCKNAVPSQDNEDSSSGSNRKRNANIGATQPKKRACPSTIFKILEKENI